MATDSLTGNAAPNSTTRRGLATASFCLGFWGMLIFWWYPFGPILGAIGATLGVLTLARGIRAGRNGENLAILGIFFGSNAVGLGIAVFHFVQAAFEGFGPYGTY
jgi:hypothetical protein